MPEKISPETRSRMMAGIRGRDTKPEMMIRQHLHAQGLRYRLLAGDLPGRPDIVLPRWRVAIFAHGCFWHGHEGCSFFRLPKTRPEFWRTKIESNAERDRRAIAALSVTNWRVAVVWECALRRDPERTLQRVARFVRGKRRYLEIAAAQDTVSR